MRIGIAILAVVFAVALYAVTAKTMLKRTAERTNLEGFLCEEAVVSYDPAKTTPARIAAAIEDALGYKVTVKEK